MMLKHDGDTWFLAVVQACLTLYKMIMQCSDGCKLFPPSALTTCYLFLQAKCIICIRTYVYQTTHHQFSTKLILMIKKTFSSEEQHLSIGLLLGVHWTPRVFFLFLKSPNNHFLSFKQWASNIVGGPYCLKKSTTLGKLKRLFIEFIQCHYELLNFVFYGKVHIDGNGTISPLFRITQRALITNFVMMQSVIIERLFFRFRK